MCLYVSSAVILANILSEMDEVSQEDIKKYCEQLYTAFEKVRDDVFINLNGKELENALAKYSQEFRYFRGHYFKNGEIILQQFNARYEENVVAIFSSTAKELSSEKGRQVYQI